MARRTRIALTALLPFIALFAVFLSFTRFSPAPDEWIWLSVGVSQFLPWYLAWLAGWGAETLRRKLVSRPAAD